VNIIPVIRDLLIRNQKAVIPGLGAFLLVQRPAHLNKATRVLTPPTVTVRFDSHNLTDDGQLANYLTRKLKVNAEIANKAIEDFRTDIEGKLKSEESVILEGLGKLSKTKAGDISFVPEEELVNRISLFEMPKIDVPQVRPGNVTVSPVTQHIPVKETQVIESSAYGKRKWVIPVVLLGLLLGMLAVIYLTGNMGLLISDIKSKFSGKENKTEQLVFGNDTGKETPAEHQDTTNSVSRELDEKMAREKALAYDNDNKVSEENNQDHRQPEELIPVQNEKLTYAKPYHIIAGSFTVLMNAEKQRATILAKGLEAEILPKKGNFYMVSLGSYDKPAEASAVIKQIQVRLQNDLWVMRNR
jgi:hypothetical protein